jgi:arylsulfatase A-like enzyme
VNYYDAHDPYTPPQPFRSKFSSNPEPRRLYKYPHWTGTYLLYLQSELQSEIDAYDGAIAYVDYHTGRLIPELQRISPDRELLVIITSDHGELFGEHDLFGHGNSLYRQVIHVPLIILVVKSSYPVEKWVSEAVSISAIPSTILEILEIDYPTSGLLSLVVLWSGEQIHDWPVSYAEIEQQPWAPPHLSVPHSRWNDFRNGF